MWGQSGELEEGIVLINRHNNRATRRALCAFFTKTSVINGNRPIPTALFTLGAA